MGVGDKYVGIVALVVVVVVVVVVGCGWLGLEGEGRV